MYGVPVGYCLKNTWGCTAEQSLSCGNPLQPSPAPSLGMALLAASPGAAGGGRGLDPCPNSGSPGPRSLPKLRFSRASIPAQTQVLPANWPSELGAGVPQGLRGSPGVKLQQGRWRSDLGGSGAPSLSRPALLCFWDLWVPTCP